MGEIARSRETDARVAAARGLEVVVSRGAVDELLRLLDDETAVVEHAAMDALVAMEKAPLKVGVRGALEKRLALTGQPNSSRARAARCLSRIAHPDSLGALAARLDDRSEDVRAACAEAVGHLKDGAPAVGPKLVDMLDDPDIEVRRQVIFALGRLRFREAAPPLIELLESEDQGMQSTALWALRAISGYPFPNSADRWKEWWKHESARVESSPSEDGDDR